MARTHPVRRVSYLAGETQLQKYYLQKPKLLQGSIYVNINVVCSLMRDKIIHELGSYLRDAVFAASDGLVTTFAVVAGAYGASLGSSVVVILGFANLFADGISMAAGTYMGVKSESDFEKVEGDNHLSGGSPVKQALITFLAFDIAGFFPLIPYVFDFENKFTYSSILMAMVLFIVGVTRAKFTKKKWGRSGLETLTIGGLAAIVAYAAGFLIDMVVI